MYVVWILLKEDQITVGNPQPQLQLPQLGMVYIPFILILGMAYDIGFTTLPS